MQWILILFGLCVLLPASIFLLRFALHRISVSGLRWRRMQRRHCRKVLRLIRRAVRLRLPAADGHGFSGCMRSLMLHVLRLRRELDSFPLIAPGSDGNPRIIHLAADIAEEGVYTAEALITALAGWEDGPAASAEVSLLPVCTGLVQCKRLSTVLQAVCSDASELHRAVRLARQLERSRRPERLLKALPFRAIGLSELLKLAQQREHPRLDALLTAWLEEQHLTAEEIQLHALQRRMQISEALRQAEVCFDALESLPWLASCEACDPLHPQLMQDPAGTYPKMDILSRHDLRRQVELASRKLGMDANAVLDRAFQLSDSSDESAVERYIGFWFQDSQGLRTLYRSLAAKWRLPFLLPGTRPELLSYLGLWGFGAAVGFLFLNAGGPVFMLPFLLLASGCIPRHLQSRRPKRSHPRMDPDSLPERVKTLVVFPAMLHDEHEAVRAVRSIKAAMHALPDQGVDFLLLGDFAPSVTAVSSSDGAIVQAAAQAVCALGRDRHVLYLQRGRAWNGLLHRYVSRGESRGALQGLCRLIVQGETEDVIAFASFEPAQLERAYDFVLTLPPACRIVPGMYEQLVQTMAHPLCSRYPAADGWRGYSILTPDECRTYDGVGLIRPDSWLEATDGLLADNLDADVLSGELSGQSSVLTAHVLRPRPSDSWQSTYQQVRQSWQLSPWQLPLVHTPSGLIANPLQAFSRFHLRERLRQSLVPLGQCALLLYAAVTQSWLLLLLTLLAFAIGYPMGKADDLLRLGCHLSLLPTRMTLSLRALLDAARPGKDVPFSPVTLEVWTQGIAAALMTGLGLAFPGFSVPSLALAVLFACFPLAHNGLAAPETIIDAPDESRTALLKRIAETTWLFFSEHMDKASRFLAPDALQFDPPKGAAAHASPRSIGADLLACLCAKELGLISANAAARRMRHIADALALLPMPAGLPCCSYVLPGLTIDDPRIDARQTGFLLASLMAAAQAIRLWLPELTPEYQELSAALMKCADRFDLKSLYDADANLFFEELDADGLGKGHISLFTDEALLLSVAARALNRIPAAHFSRLQRIRTVRHRQDLPLSEHGDASAHLLASLFFPLDEQETAAYIHAMKRHGQNDVFGQDACAHYAFDADLRYLSRPAGLEEAALAPVSAGSVFAPHAAALCLPTLPGEAADALFHFVSLGALGPEGFCDAVDLTDGVRLIGLQDSFHQALTLAAAAHHLADAPVRRCFCAIPEVEACLPLLAPVAPALVLPRLPFLPIPADQMICDAVEVNARLLPAPVSLLGSRDFRIAATGYGTLQIYDGQLPLLYSDGCSGLTFLLSDGDRVFRLGDPAHLSSIVFSSGEVRTEQLCGSLRAETVCFADTVRRRALHLLTVTNVSTQDRLITLTDCLLPDLGVQAATLEADEAAPDHLILHARGTGRTLHHTISASAAPLSMRTSSDTAALQDSLPESDTRLWRRLSYGEPVPCLSFQARYPLGGRGQLSIWFITSLAESDPPLLTDISGLRNLSAMQHRAMLSASGMHDSLFPAAVQLLPLLTANGGRLGLRMHPDDPDTVLTDLIAISGWLFYCGVRVALTIGSPRGTLSHLLALTEGHPNMEHTLFVLPDAQELETHPLLFTSDLPLMQQLESFCFSVSRPPIPHQPPRPGSMPEVPLVQQGSFGGFDPENRDYLLQLEPGQATPLPWTNRHQHRRFQESVDESGFAQPFGEQVLIEMQDGPQLSPWAKALPRRVRMGTSETTWEAWSDVLDIRLQAACLTGHPCSLRVLRLRNTSDEPLSMTVSILAQLAHSPCALECADGIVIARTPESGRQAFIAGAHWQSSRTHAYETQTVTGFLPLYPQDLSDGTTAMLQQRISLPPRSSRKLVWIAGYARHSEEIAHALAALQEGPSAALLDSRTAWAARLDRLTVSTPEETLDMLMNRILPVQALHAGTDGFPVLLALSPMSALRTLIAHARRADSAEDWARLAVMMAEYIRTSGDASLADAVLPRQNAPLYRCCADALLTLPLDQQDLPSSEDAARLCFLIAIAAGHLNTIRPDPALSALRKQLLHAADTHLWKDGCYGSPLRLELQALAWQACGDTPRTRQALRTCWEILYDQPHGLIRQREPDHAPPLPGLPANGGMVTRYAADFLQAMLHSGMAEEAFELLRALNPLHHTDEPSRQNVFRCAPYLLHGGMCASPAEAGRGVAADGSRAASRLYSVILHDVLGFDRRGDVLRIRPCVPPEWDTYTLTLQEGTSTWRISLERRIDSLTIDGLETGGDQFTLADDGKVHRVRIPLT